MPGKNSHAARAARIEGDANEDDGVEDGMDAQEASPSRPAGLTKNEKLVWDVLAAALEPLKAYEILDRLKERGVRAPMTIYRALDGLETKGVIHKLDGLNAFVLCNHEGPHEVQAFLVCDGCTAVQEIEIESVSAGVAPAVRRTGFDMRTARLEVRGYCDGCGPAAQSA